MVTTPDGPAGPRRDDGRGVARAAARMPRRGSPPTSTNGSGRSITSPTVRSTIDGSRYARSSRPFSVIEPTMPSTASPSGCSDTGSWLIPYSWSIEIASPTRWVVRASTRPGAGRRGGGRGAGRRPGRPRRSWRAARSRASTRRCRPSTGSSGRCRAGSRRRRRRRRRRSRSGPGRPRARRPSPSRTSRPTGSPPRGSAGAPSRTRRGR